MKHLWGTTKLLGVVVVFAVGVTTGATRHARVAVDERIMWDVITLHLLDTGDTDRIRSFAETRLVGALNLRDSLKSSPIHISPALQRPLHGPRWEMQLEWATGRVQTQRAELAYLLANPEEALKRLADAMQETLRQEERTNAQVRIERGENGRLITHIDGLLTEGPDHGPVTMTLNERQCVNNLRMIYSAMDVASGDHGYNRGDTIPRDYISRYIRGGIDGLRCPDEGDYLLRPYGEQPECTVHGALPLRGAWTLPSANGPGSAQRGAEGNAADRAP